MQKKVLSEQALYFGQVNMPKGFEIDRNKLSDDILQSSSTSKEFLFSRTWDMLNTYIRDYVNLNYEIILRNKNSWGDIYKPNQKSKPLVNVDPINLKNSPDFTALYGIHVKNCWVKIYYNDNRRKGRSWDIELTDNKFVMFPSTNMYYITNEQEKSSNFIQTITYEYL